jgi:aspartyl-tRNA(Asn)/glutamyl-tRNA(Gln) amidotransferase subunit A
VTELAGIGVLRLSELLRTRAVSSREVVGACLASIERRDAGIGAWARTYPELALEQAAAADRRFARAADDCPPPLLCGVPIGVKDVIAIAGMPLTLGSRAFAGASAPHDAAAWARLRAEGMVLLGHTRTQELALGNAPQEVRNPWDPSRSPGGSSNGSAAAIAAGMVPAAIGTDVGGSLRRPASACGLTTVMATTGCVSTNGVFTFDAAADHVGPLAHDAADCAVLLDAMATANPAPCLAEIYAPGTPAGGAIHGRRLGLVSAFDSAGPSAAVGEVLARCGEELSSLGAELVEVAAPRAPELDGRPRPEEVDFFRVHLAAPGSELSPPVREHGAELLRRAARDGVRSDRANRATIGAWRRGWEELFAARRLDALLLPAQMWETPLLPPPGAGGDLNRFGDPGIRAIWNRLGLPVACMPAGPACEGGMPLGVQLVGPPHSEATLLRIAAGYQVATPYHRRRPEPGPTPVPA